MSVTLLKFSVANFKSFRDTQTLVFHPGSPEDKQFDPNPVTVLLGANASGKSNILDAMHFALRAIRQSATAWLEDDIYFRNMVTPFLLDGYSSTQPSFFEFDFLVDQTRYLYGFEYDRSGVAQEWMSYIPSRNWTPIFNRNVDLDTPWTWNNSAVPRSQQRELENGGERELVLSLAARSRMKGIGEVARRLTEGVSYLPLGDNQKDQRLTQVAKAMRERKVMLSEVSTMMQAADTGIQNVTIDEDNLPSRLAELAKRLTQTLAERRQELGEDTPLPGFSISPEQGSYIESDENLKTIAYQLMFSHKGDEGARALKTADQSDGTLTWLSAAPNIIDTLRDGTVIIADELDSSLHSQLLELVVKSFTDELTNVHGAQLIFSTHDTNLLEHRKDLDLSEASFWFVEKTPNGVSEVYRLSEFDTHQDANYERRYLSGRYGAIPHVSPSLIRGLVLAPAEREDPPTEMDSDEELQ